MYLYAWKNGVTTVDEANMNALISGNIPTLITEGIQRAAKNGTGISENNIANYSYCTRFTLAGSTEIGRVALHLDRDSLGADLVVQIRSGMNPSSGVDGTLVKQVVVPKEFIPDPAAYWSIPIGLTGLTSGGQYWIVVGQSGDATNHLDWIGEAAQDASYPAYRRNGTSGAWTANNALHFRVYSGASGDYAHSIDNVGGHATLVYNGEDLAAIYDYLPATDGPEGGIRDITTLVYSGDYILGGV
ncbi:MAG: hypothetical protein VB084_06440 [Syntrophomonadaceae bacterium]|nr:hypothetical protein [Syntrophomonadaceae bacterium]